jgi:hypothetical protein
LDSRKRFCIRNTLILLIVLALASAAAAYDADPKGVADGKAVFVDQNNPACSDNRGWTTATDPAKPLCTVQKAMDIAESGGTIYIRAASYNAWHTFYNKNPSNQITFTNYPDEKPILTNSFSELLETGRGRWQKKTDASTYWVSVALSDEMIDNAAVHLSDGTQLATYSSLSAFKSSRMDAAYIDTGRKQVYVRFKDTAKDPNTFKVYVSKKGPGVMHIKGIGGAGVKIKGLTIQYGSTQVYVEDSSKVILDSNKLVGGMIAIYLIGGDGRDLSSCEVKYNDIQGKFNSNWDWMDIKGGGGLDPMETAGIRTRKQDLF